MERRTLSALVCLLGGLLGCSDPVEPSGQSILLSFAEPPPSAAAPGTSFPEIKLQATTSDGSPARGVRLLVTGDGEFSAGELTTDGSGNAVLAWTLPRWTDPLDPLPVVPPFGIPGEFNLRVATPDGGAVLAIKTTARVFRAQQIDASAGYGCGINNEGLWCWGSPGARLVGVNTGVPATRVVLPPQVVAAEVRLNDQRICVRDAATGTPWCLQTLVGPSAFLPVPDAPPLLDLVDMGDRFCGRAVTNRHPWCWRMADGAMEPATEISAMEFVALVGDQAFPGATSEGHACGLTAAGAVWCWGANGAGQLGDGGTTPSAVPRHVVLPEPLVALRAAGGAVCGETASGADWCWGDASGGGSNPVTLPRRIDAMGSEPQVVIPGWVSLYTLGAAGLEEWLDGEQLPPFRGLASLVEVASVVDGGQACALGADGEVYCSWIMLGGGSDTRVTSADLRPVHWP